MIFTLFDKETGRAMGRRTGAIRGDLRTLVAVEGDHAGCCLVDGKPVPMATMALKVDGNTISGLPEGAEILRSGHVIHVAIGGAVTLRASWAETVALEVRHPRFHPARVTVDCEPSDGDLALVQDHAALRAALYPSLGDQLDALWKGGAAAEEMQRRVMAVKARVPKP
jgi:hypothetical protein